MEFLKVGYVTFAHFPIADINICERKAAVQNYCHDENETA